MNIKISKQIVFLFITFLLNSCSSIYIPSTVNIPLLEEKGEKQVEGTLSTNSLHLTGNYAFSEKYSVMLNAALSYGNFSNSYDIFTRKYEMTDESNYIELRDYGEFSHKYVELGIGRYNILKKTFKIELFSGCGYGLANDYKWGSSYVGKMKYDASYFLGFFQLNMGITHKKVDFGWAMRVASSFYDYNYQIDPSSDYSDHKNGTSQNINFNLVHIEPMAFIRVGNEKLKFVGRIGLSNTVPIESLGKLDVDRGIYNGKINATILHFSVGINLKLK